MFHNQGKIILFEHFEKLHGACIIAGSALSVSYKLTRAHLYPDNFQKMNVRLAAQVFSRTVANSFNYLRTIDVDHMMEFAGIVNRTFQLNLL